MKVKQKNFGGFIIPDQEAAPPPPPAFKPFSMTCKEEGCGFVTDTAEDEAHLPLVMKVVVVLVVVEIVVVAKVGMTKFVQMMVVTGLVLVLVFMRRI